MIYWSGLIHLSSESFNWMVMILTISGASDLAKLQGNTKQTILSLPSMIPLSILKIYDHMPCSYKKFWFLPTGPCGTRYQVKWKNRLNYNTYWYSGRFTKWILMLYINCLFYRITSLINTAGIFHWSDATPPAV